MFRRAAELEYGFNGADVRVVELLAIAAHELRTPLTSLKLQNQFLQRAIKNGDQSVDSKPKVDKLTVQTSKQIARLIKWVEDMLDIGRMSSGKVELELSEFDLSEFTRECLERVEPLFLEGDSPAPSIVRAEIAFRTWDQMRLEQVLSNLLTNAFRYGRKGPVEVRVWAKNDACFPSVKDFGVGISQDALEKIFNRFERAIAAYDVSGLGLGLYIARQVVEAPGGRPTVQSTLGEGSEFTISLPVSNSARFHGARDVT